MNIILISTLVSSVVFPFVGKICDNHSPKITIPVAFFFRCLTCFLFFTIERPDSMRSYVTCTLMIVGTIVENISVDSIFSKNLPKETRAILSGAYSFFGQVGILVYSLGAGKLYDIFGP
jgi:MFS-type transporter involved in bile tolerance (Atg22 family)